MMHFPSIFFPVRKGFILEFRSLLKWEFQEEQEPDFTWFLPKSYYLVPVSVMIFVSLFSLSLICFVIFLISLPCYLSSFFTVYSGKYILHWHTVATSDK